MNDTRPKKLYAVMVEVEVVVAARDEVEACYEAESVVSVEDDGASLSTLAREVKSENYLPDEWELDAIPFNSDDDKTIGEYLAAPSGRRDVRLPITDAQRKTLERRVRDTEQQRCIRAVRRHLSSHPMLRLAADDIVAEILGKQAAPAPRKDSEGT